MGQYTIRQLKHLKESEDKVEFKKAEQGNFAYDGGTKAKPSERRRCILGYVTAFCNEGGGSLVIGMEDAYPHKVVGTKQCEGRLGELESNIYRDTLIRPHVYELYEDEKNKTGRVLVIEVPGRPTGKLFRFEDVPLMRVGEELKPMSDEMIFSILQEHEPDFSAEICKGITIRDLDPEAIRIMKQKYAQKQQNPDFLTLSDEQVLSDLDLIKNGAVTYAALILVGQEKILKEHLPQASVILEFRKSESLVPFTNRQIYCQPFYKMIDLLWHDIDLRNDKIDVNENSYIFNIPYFNEEVIREAINNAIAHRDYRRNSETVIKQYPQKMEIMNAGGFPLGVTIENLLRVQSTPRNRLLADVLSKTGIVERSGQGVDKIYRNTLSEGKDAPDYSKSDSFRVELHISAVIKDKAFAMFLNSEQRDLPEEEKLSVFDVIALNAIREGKSNTVSKDVLKELMKRGIIEKHGKTRGTYYTLSKSYYEFCGKEGEYSQVKDWNAVQAWPVILAHFSTFKKAKMRDFVSILGTHMSRRKIRVIIDQYVAQRYLAKEGAGSGTTYFVSEEYIRDSAIMNKALGIGLEELKRRGEID
ncbi:MAG: putative DNA binding domain-containing protein [Bacteroidales bacterium]|nr:putative DNA binding domain-containing protein [Bacteroidales bacterium]